MGLEAVQPITDAPIAGLKAGQSIQRRFTNIWKRDGNTWRLFIRHANVRWTVTQPDGRIGARFGAFSGTVTFSSTRSAALFELLGPVRRLNPELADLLIRDDRQLAKAAAVYPHGHDLSDHAAARATPPIQTPEERAERVRQNDVVPVGDQYFRLIDALNSDFKEPLEEALRMYDADTHPRRGNLAPKECWPSGYAFRSIVCRAARYEGRQTIRLLDRSPDEDLRVLAQITLAAELAGLPELGGVMRFKPMIR